MWAAEALKRIGTPEALKAVKKYKSKINWSSLCINGFDHYSCGDF
jgi:hypothetical protein